MSYNLTSDCIYHISQFLNCKDIYNLSMINKTSKRKIKYVSALIQSLLNKLSFLDSDKLNIFINLLKKYKCVIYGSIVLQAIMDVNYDDSDIDIYVKSDVADEF